MEELKVYTDGSCITDKYTTKHGQAGYAFLIEHPTKQYVDSGTINAASNGAELIAIIKAIEFIADHTLLDGFESVIIHTDSKYVVNGVNKWLQLWKGRDWKRVDVKKIKEKGPHIEYMEEWKRLDHLLQHYPVKVKWIPGHVGISQNEITNTLAKKAAMKGR